MPYDTTKRHDLIDARVHEMENDVTQARLWLNEATESEEVMRTLAQMVVLTFSDDDKIDASGLRMELQNKYEIWCRAQVEAQAAQENGDGK